MKLILSIETAATAVSVALHQSGKLVTALEHHVARSHSQVLVGMIDQLFKVHPGSMEQLAAVAISAGPGSYTGLRVGTSVAKGLCYGRSLPLISLNTLSIMVQACLHLPLAPGVYCPLLDARRGYAYGLIASQQGPALTGTFRCMVSTQVFEKWLKKGPVYFMGSGAEHYEEKLKMHPNSHLVRGFNPKAAHMGGLAQEGFSKGLFTDSACLEPCY